MRLKPCPHCGYKGVELVWDETRYSYVVCPACFMQGPGSFGDDHAIIAWNALPRFSDIAQLNREADWLAEQLSRVPEYFPDRLPCPSDVEFGESKCPFNEEKSSFGCVQMEPGCWRDEARFAVYIKKTQENDTQ